jgi:hypothetical protein
MDTNRDYAIALVTGVHFFFFFANIPGLNFNVLIGEMYRIVILSEILNQAS